MLMPNTCPTTSSPRESQASQFDPAKCRLLREARRLGFRIYSVE